MMIVPIAIVGRTTSSRRYKAIASQKFQNRPRIGFAAAACGRVCERSRKSGLRNNFQDHEFCNRETFAEWLGNVHSHRGIVEPRRRCYPHMMEDVAGCSADILQALFSQFKEGSITNQTTRIFGKLTLLPRLVMHQ